MEDKLRKMFETGEGTWEIRAKDHKIINQGGFYMKDGIIINKEDDQPFVVIDYKENNFEVDEKLDDVITFKKELNEMVQRLGLEKEDVIKIVESLYR